jgi:hypothetical protein
MPHRGQVERVAPDYWSPSTESTDRPSGNEGNTAKIGQQLQESE